MPFPRQICNKFNVQTAVLSSYLSHDFLTNSLKKNIWLPQDVENPIKYNEAQKEKDMDMVFWIGKIANQVSNMNIWTSKTK